MKTCPRRLHYKQHILYRHRPAERPSIGKFLDDGILLPFAFPRHLFTKPNYTLWNLRSSDAHKWRLDEWVLPGDGWRGSDVRQTKAGHASNDIMGSLYFYLMRIIMAFFHKIRRLKIDFVLMQSDATTLPLVAYEQGWSFDRIETSNVTHFLSTDFLVGVYSNLLKPANPHATLITSYMCAVLDMIWPQRKEHIIKRAMKKAKPYLPPTDWHLYDMLRCEIAAADPGPGDHDGTNIGASVHFQQCCFDFFACNYELYFSRYGKDKNFAAIEESTNMKMKTENTIVEKWPLMLKKKPGDDGCAEELIDHVSDGRVPWLRYVEWFRPRPV
ncbi:hypothetical protein F4779DRAFT_597693 [Xylariaceae sp. FL0662B]|nr:hypothetical protein F4779DRAFT_597693 [Xylariaceae sp. FL0662B]